MKTTAQQHANPNGKSHRRILAVDVGGSHVKVLLNSEVKKRRFSSGPELTASEMVAQVKAITSDWAYDVVSLGYPGPVVDGKPITEPFNLGRGWTGFDYSGAFGCPVKIVNDAVMQALGSYTGGRMLFLGLGTGLGAAMIIDGTIEPMELAHMPYKKGKSFEYYLGEDGLERAGERKWRVHVATVVEHLKGILEPDYVVLGGGNARKIEELPPVTRLGDNANAFTGGFRLWDGYSGGR